MNKKQKIQLEAVQTLKEWGLNDGSTVYSKVNHVSASGMSRNIGLYIAQPDGSINDISYHAAHAIGWPYVEGYKGGVKVSGCGMDMIFHTISSLSYAMSYGDLCQNPGQTEPVNKLGINGQTIKAIGLKYRHL